MIYFIVAPDAQRCKIGFSADPRSRFCKIKVDSPVLVELRAVCAGSPADEKALHQRFRDARIAGEWYSLTPELNSHIDGISKNGLHLSNMQLRRNDSRSGSIINKLGGVKSVGAICGVAESTVHRWTYPKPKGTGGVIPYKYVQPILRYAKIKQINLSPADFVPGAS